MPLREGLHERMQCDMRQHFVERCWLHEHPKRHSSWKESTRMKFLNMPSECSKMRSESSDYMWKNTGAFLNSWRIKTALESYFEEHAQEVWERNWMDREMQTMLVEHVSSKIDCDDSEGTSRTT